MKRRAYMIDKDCNRWTTAVDEESSIVTVIERRNGASTDYEIHKVVVDEYVIALIGVERVGMGKVKPSTLSRALLGEEKVAPENDEGRGR